MISLFLMLILRNGCQCGAQKGAQVLFHSLCEGACVFVLASGCESSDDEGDENSKTIMALTAALQKCQNMEPKNKAKKRYLGFGHLHLAMTKFAIAAEGVGFWSFASALAHLDVLGRIAGQLVGAYLSAHAHAHISCLQPKLARVRRNAKGILPWFMMKLRGKIGRKRPRGVMLASVSVKLVGRWTLICFRAPSASMTQTRPRPRTASAITATLRTRPNTSKVSRRIGVAITMASVIGMITKQEAVGMITNQEAVPIGRRTKVGIDARRRPHLLRYQLVSLQYI